MHQTTVGKGVGGTKNKKKKNGNNSNAGGGTGWKSKNIVGVYFTKQDLREVFCLHDTSRSKTQEQLANLHPKETRLCYKGLKEELNDVENMIGNTIIMMDVF